jgi:hypothetical protein
MEPLKKHGDPLEEEIRKEPVRGADEVSDNQPGSKGWRSEEDQEIVRSASQKPNPNQPSDDATMEPGGDLGQKRNTM